MTVYALTSPQPAGLLEAKAITLPCPKCGGSGRLAGRNWVAQGYVAPSCWGCNGQGRIAVTDAFMAALGDCTACGFVQRTRDALCPPHERELMKR